MSSESKSGNRPAGGGSELFEGFEQRGLSDWLALVEASGGKPSGLGVRTYDGVEVPALLTAVSGALSEESQPLASWRARAASSARVENGWDVRQVHNNPELEAGNAAILEDLENGVSSIEVRLDEAGRAGLDADQGGDAVCRGGISLSSVDDLDRLLAGVYLDAAPIALDAGAGAQAAAAMLVSLWERREVAAEAMTGSFNADPLGLAATMGTAGAPLERALNGAVQMALDNLAARPGVTALRADAVPYHDAGASEAQEVACALATAVAYARLLMAEGASQQAAFSQISVRLALDGQLFAGIAKLRATRSLWQRIEAISRGGQVGAEDETAPGGERPLLQLEATGSWRSLTRVDAWSNLLRVTTAGVAAAIGGADRLTTMPFDALLGVPAALGRRVARNTQAILREESHLHRVVDPAAGAWFLEELTARLERAAWAELQSIEREGGMAESLLSGALQARLVEVARQRGNDVANRRAAIIGVSEFPELDGKAPGRPVLDVDTLRGEALARLGERREAKSGTLESFADAIQAAGERATLGELAGQLEGSSSATDVEASIEPLVRRRDAEPYEQLRDAAAAAGSDPGKRIFLANLGRMAEWNARATFARNLLAAGGIDASVAEDSEHSPDGGFLVESNSEWAEVLAASFRASGARAAVLCSTDRLYAASAASAASILRDAGAGHLLLAGKPGDDEPALRDAGVGTFLYQGCPALEVLQHLHEVLGIAGKEQEGLERESAGQAASEGTP